MGDWEVPSAWVRKVADSWHDSGVRTVLDLGCGIGRHTLALHSLGFSVRALDRSESGCARTRERCAQAGADVEVRQGDVTELPYPDASFDAVLAYNVVYHGTEDDLRSCLAEVRRVLRPAGRYASTMLSKRNAEYGRGTEIAPNTFVQPGATDDKVHPHLYCDAADLVRLHSGLELLGCRDISQSSPDSYHWYCEFELGGPR